VLYSIQKLPLLKAIIVLSYASKSTKKTIYVFYFLKVQSVKLRCVCLIRLYHIVITINRARVCRQIGLNFSVTFRDKIAPSSR